MKSNKTHDMMTKMLFPHLPMSTISAVNRNIDNPSKAMVAFNRMFQTSKNYPIKGLSKYGHREYNHDWMSAVMTGFMTGGIEGATAAYAHILEDLASDMAVRRYGSPARDMAEAAYNYNMYLIKNRRR